MSFLSRSHPILRQATVVKLSPRFFSTTFVQQKGPIEATKDVAKAVDRTISDQIVKGIDKGIEVKDSAASTVGINAKKAEGEASATAGQVQGKANELAGEAKGKAEEIKGKL